jgi:putative flippase GtrA
MRHMITRKRVGELLRYGVTGALCVALKVAFVVLLTEYLGIHYLVSAVICSTAVAVVGFLLNKSWTFHRRGTAITPEFLRYTLTTLISMAVGLATCAWLVQNMRVPYFLALALVAVAFAPLTYVLHRGWAFRMAWRYES